MASKSLAMDWNNEEEAPTETVRDKAREEATKKSYAELDGVDVNSEEYADYNYEESVYWKHMHTSTAPT